MALMKKAAPADPVAALEQKQVELRVQRDQAHEQISDMQQELAGLLGSQHGAALARAPLEKAVQAAQTAVRDAQEALARNIGKVGEDIHAGKAYEAEEAQRQAQEALSAFEKQQKVAVIKERIASLRTAIAQGEQELRDVEQRLLTVSSEIDQVVEAAHNAALLRIFTTYADLFVILEQDGPALARMRLRDADAFQKMLEELEITQSQLFDLISPSSFSSAGYDMPIEYNGPRPYLEERQQLIKARLARLKKS